MTEKAISPSAIQLADESTAWPPGVRPRTRIFGRRLLHLRECSSTNDVAAEMLSASDAHGRVVLADFQTVGRGRRGRRWLSPPGANLLFSLALREPTPEIMPPALGLGLGFGLGLGIVDGLKRAGFRGLGLRWPNDVQCTGTNRKVAGVLCERRRGGLVAGIGINVNAAPSDDEVERPATSLVALACGPSCGAGDAGCSIDRFSVLANVLEGLENWWDRLTAGNGTADAAEVVCDAYRAACITLGRRVRVRAQGSKDVWQDAQVHDVDSSGRLCVRLADGAEVALSDPDALDQDYYV